MGRRALGGAMWTTLQTFGSKGVTIISQVILGYLLNETEWGLFAPAWGLMAFAVVVQNSGLRQVLIYRRHPKWENMAFWMAGLVGALAAVLLALVAPWGAAAMGDPRLTPVVYALCPYVLLSAMLVVPLAKAQRQLRFRLLAFDAFMASFSVAVLTIAFASLGLGALSFALPFPISAGMRLAWLSGMTRPRIRARPDVRRWRYLISDTATIYIGRLAQVFTRQGDYLILGLFHPQAVVGHYFFAYRLSFQTVNLFSTNIMHVLHPVLTRMKNEPARQIAGYFKAERAMAMVGIPLSIFQATLAEPVIRMVYPGGRWDAAIPALQMLSIGMGVRLMMNVSQSLMLAGGRYRLLTGSSLCYAGIFATTVTVAAWVSPTDQGALWTAGAVAVTMIVYGPIQIFLAVRYYGEGWSRVLGIFPLPFAIGFSAFGSMYLLSRLIPAAAGLDYLWRALIIALPGPVIYLLLLRWWGREVYDMFVGPAMTRLHRAFAWSG